MPPLICLDIADFEIGLHGSSPTILIGKCRFHVYAIFIRVIKCINKIAIFLCDKLPPHLSGAGDLTVIRVQLLMKEEVALDLGILEPWVLAQTPVYLEDGITDEVIYGRFLGEVCIACKGDMSSFGPVCHCPVIDVDENGHIVFAHPMGHGLL